MGWSGRGFGGRDGKGRGKERCWVRRPCGGGVGAYEGEGVGCGQGGWIFCKSGISGGFEMERRRCVGCGL